MHVAHRAGAFACLASALHALATGEAVLRFSADPSATNNPHCRMLSLEKVEGKHYSRNLWAPSTNRPAYGGQLFAHILKIALCDNLEWCAAEAHCVFKNKAEPGKEIEYSIVGSEPVGGRMKYVTVKGVQRKGDAQAALGGAESTLVVTGTVLLQLNTSRFEEIVRHPGKDLLREYFGRAALTDEQKRERMMKSPLCTPLTFNEPVTLHDVASEAKNVNVHILPHPKELYQRCVCFQLDGKIAEQIEREFLLQEERNIKNPREKLACLLLSLLTDKYLLETAVSYRLEDEGVPLNTLSLDHHVRFSRLADFDMRRCFFYSLKVEEVENNKAFCTGKIVQNGRVFAYSMQNGIIRRNGHATANAGGASPTKSRVQ